MNVIRFWEGRPGLAGGIDKDGSRAAELLAAGFGSVEFGTVTPQPEPGHNPGVAALAARLAGLGPGRRGDALIGVSLGMGRHAPPAALAAHWLAGLEAAWAAADYLSFNLSAQGYRPLALPHNLAQVRRALAAAVDARERRAVGSGRRVPLALKLSLGSGGEPLPAIAGAAAEAGFDALIAVLPQGTERLPRLRALVRRLRGGPAVIAVGGLRTAQDVRSVLAAGAAGVQIHRAFAQSGTDCLPPLLEGLAAPDIHEGEFPNPPMAACASGGILAP